jgi:hypothetical protein
MSTSPEDRIVNALSRWLAGHMDNEELRGAIARAGPQGLSPGQAEAIKELVEELEGANAPPHAEVERLVRETLEALALG